MDPITFPHPVKTTDNVCIYVEADQLIARCNICENVKHYRRAVILADLVADMTDHVTRNHPR